MNIRFVRQVKLSPAMMFTRFPTWHIRIIPETYYMTFTVYDGQKYEKC